MPQLRSGDLPSSDRGVRLLFLCGWDLSTREWRLFVDELHILFGGDLSVEHRRCIISSVRQLPRRLVPGELEGVELCELFSRNVATWCGRY